MKKKVLAVALAAAMTVGTVPAAVFAEEEEKPYEGVTLSMWIGTSVYHDGTKAILEKATEELGMEFEVEINPEGTEGTILLRQDVHPEIFQISVSTIQDLCLPR